MILVFTLNCSFLFQMKEIKNLKLKIPNLSDPVSKGAFSLSLRMQLPPKLPSFKTLHTVTMSEPCLPLLALLLPPDGLPLSEKKKKLHRQTKKRKKGFGVRAQLADPDGKARKWRSSDCMALPAGCGMAREPCGKKKKKTRRKKRNANSASPASLSLGQWRQTVIGSLAR